jgi:hypothetical protein
MAHSEESVRAALWRDWMEIFPLTKGGKKAERQRSRSLQGVVVNGLGKADQTTPWRFVTTVASRRPLC